MWLSTRCVLTVLYFHCSFHKTEDQSTRSVPFTRYKLSLLLCETSERSICARSIANNPHTTTPRERSSHTENSPRTDAILASARCLTHGRPVLPGREYSGESIARVIDASADVAFSFVVWGTRFLNVAIYTSWTSHFFSFFFFPISSEFVEFRSAMRRVAYVCW